MIAKESIPPVSEVVSTGVAVKVLERLGDDAGYKLASLTAVNQILTEEMGVALNSCDSKSNLGKTLRWSNSFQTKVVQQSGQLFTEVGKAVLERCPELQDQCADGRCVCGTLKVLKCLWHSDTEPSFFWGCSKYTRFDQYRYDKAVGAKGVSVHRYTN